MRVLAAIIAFSSFSAFAACPNLAGTYATCRSTTGSVPGSTDMVISQKIQNGVTVYTITSTDDESHERESEEVYADGKTRTHTEESEIGQVVASITYTCSGVKVIGKQSLTVAGEALLDMTTEVQKKGAALEMDYTGSAFGQAFEDTLICE